MTRIVAGELGGKRLIVPPRGTRPTSEKVREAIFSTLAATGLLAGGRVADLCAGSGALGFEALSRGAQRVDFVELNQRAAATIATNAEALQVRAKCTIHRQNVRTFFASEQLVAWDVIFFDPPYCQAAELTPHILRAIAAGQLLAEAGLVVVETGKRTRLQLPDTWQVWREKRYGDTRVTYLEQLPNDVASDLPGH